MCNYYTCNKKQIEKHFLSSKHIKNSSNSAPVAPSCSLQIEPLDTFSSQLEEQLPLAPPNTPDPMICECCGKTYKSKSTFARHQCNKKRDTQIIINDDNISVDDQENVDQSLELISDDDSCNIEFEYMTIDPLIMNPLIINNDVMYFMQVFMYSIDVVMGISVFINKVFSFFSLKSDDDSN
jgi:hypothetical protein